MRGAGEGKITDKNGNMELLKRASERSQEELLEEIRVLKSELCIARSESNRFFPKC